MITCCFSFVFTFLAPAILIYLQRQILDVSTFLWSAYKKAMSICPSFLTSGCIQCLKTRRKILPRNLILL